MLSAPIHIDSSSKLQFFNTGSASTFRKMSLTNGANGHSSSAHAQNNPNCSYIVDDVEYSNKKKNNKHSAASQQLQLNSLAAKYNLPYVPDQIFIGGRKSKLAVAQSEIIKGLIKETFPTIACPILALTTLGDQVQNKPLYSFGGKALWTKELEILLLQDLGEYHQLDLIVHSLKDMPTNLPDDFELGCIVKREDPSDAVLMAKDSPYKSLKDLPAGSVVGTSSVRRSAQLKRNFPHLKFESIRGNVQTRISKLDDEKTDFKCIILATAGLTRVGLEHRITERLDATLMYYAVGQGALGIEIRKNDSLLTPILKTIEDRTATICCYAERALMRTLEGGCSVPIGVWSNYDEAANSLHLKGLVISVDGTKWVEDEITYQINDYKLDSAKAGELLAQAMIVKGAKEILDEINLDKINEKDE